MQLKIQIKKIIDLLNLFEVTDLHCITNWEKIHIQKDKMQLEKYIDIIRYIDV